MEETRKMVGRSEKEARAGQGAKVGEGWLPFPVVGMILPPGSSAVDAIIGFALLILTIAGG